MSVKPIDMQVMLPKMTEIAMAQGSESQRFFASSQKKAQRTKAAVEAAAREVRTRENVQKVSFKNRDESGGADVGQGGGKGRRRGSGGASGSRTPKTSIDIKL